MYEKRDQKKINKASYVIRWKNFSHFQKTVCRCGILIIIVG